MATSGRTLQFERMLFFSDAVFAIAITLLVIEIRLPHIALTTDTAVAQALADLIPNYIGFIVSFFVVGRFWIGHHAQFAFIDHVDRPLLWRNLLFLGAIAFMPFPTAVVVERGASAVAVIFYGAWLILAGLLDMLLFKGIERIAAAQPGGVSAEQHALTRGAWMPVIIGATACAGALVHPLAGIACLTVSPLIMRLFQRFSRARTA